MVHFLDCNVPAVLQAFLTEGVLLHVPLTDRPPPAAIALGTVIAAREAVVVLVHLLLMLWAVLLPILTELSASGPAAWSFWFHRHRSASSCITKAPEVLTFEASLYLSCDYTISYMAPGHFRTFPAHLYNCRVFRNFYMGQRAAVPSAYRAFISRKLIAYSHPCIILQITIR